MQCHEPWIIRYLLLCTRGLTKEMEEFYHCCYLWASSTAPHCVSGFLAVLHPHTHTPTHPPHHPPRGLVECFPMWGSLARTGSRTADLLCKHLQPCHLWNEIFLLQMPVLPLNLDQWSQVFNALINCLALSALCHAVQDALSGLKTPISLA